MAVWSENDEWKYHPDKLQGAAIHKYDMKNVQIVSAKIPNSLAPG